MESVPEMSMEHLHSLRFWPSLAVRFRLNVMSLIEVDHFSNIITSVNAPAGFRYDSP